MSDGLHGRVAGAVALVTAAGQGLGEAIAEILAEEGASVALSDINGAELERVAGSLAARGGHVMHRVSDATRSADVRTLVREVEAEFGRVDILVNAAGGFQRFAPITDIAEDEWDHVIALNLKSAFLCAQAVAAGMIERKRGRIINIASQGGIGPNPYAPSYLPYGTAKAAMIGFTKHLAKDLGPHGITVNAVSPGTTLTPRVRKVRDAASIERIRSQNPMGVLVEPIDCAEAVLFLASDASRYITGVNLSVNAGTLIV